MPFIRISLAGTPPSDEQVRQLQARTTALMAEVLGKRPEVTVVAVEAVPSANWSVGGSALGEDGVLAQMEAFITAGTNRDEEKAAFISSAYDMLAEVLGTQASPIYVVVQEIPATSWGFDGKTQAARLRASQAL